MPDSTDYSQALACTIGSASFGLVRYDVQIQAVTKPGIGHYCDQVTARLEGQVQADSPADLSMALANVANSLKDGQDVTITGLGGEQEFSCVAARCFDGGPFIDFEMEEESPVPLVKMIRLTIHTDQLPLGNTAGQYQYNVTTSTRPDGLQTVTWDGQSTSPLGSTYLNNTVIPAFKQAYNGPQYAITTEYTTSASGVMTTIRFRFTATQYFGSLSDYGGSGAAVEGSVQMRTERDEHFRKVTTWEFDLQLGTKADASDTLTDLRNYVIGKGQGGAGAQIILRESATIEQLRDNHLRASFTVMASAGNDALMNWRRTIQIKYPDQPAEEHTYIGAAPILVQLPQRNGQISDNGSAISADQWLQPPAEIYASLPHVEPPEADFEYLNEVEKQTTWRRRYWVTADNNGGGIGGTGGGSGGSQILSNFTPDALERPSNDQFYSQPAPTVPVEDQS